MTEATRFSHTLRFADLPARKPTRFDLQPTSAELSAIAPTVGAQELRKVRLKGELRPLGRTDWELQATLGATVVQPCTVSLAPVTTRLEEKVERRWLRDMPEPSGDEIEMPEDDSIEPLAPEIDLGAVLTEALTLAMPLYPRAPEAELGDASFTEPGKEPLREGDVRPFASLAGLRDKLVSKDANGVGHGTGDDKDDSGA